MLLVDSCQFINTFYFLQKPTLSNFSTCFIKPVHIFLCKLGQNFDYDKKDTFICISFASCNGICATIWRNVDSYRAE